MAKTSRQRERESEIRVLVAAQAVADATARAAVHESRRHMDKADMAWRSAGVAAQRTVSNLRAYRRAILRTAKEAK